MVNSMNAVNQTGGAGRRRGFTLIELLVTITVIAVLASLGMAMLPQAKLAARRTASLSNLRGIGSALIAFANDNDGKLPGRVQSSDKWPRLLLPYVDENPKIYGEPDDLKCFVHTGADPTANGRNNTSYILNGFNDVGAFGDESIIIRTLNIEKPSMTILMANQSGTGNFYMDFMEGNQNHVLNLKAYGTGSNYLFADGSARFLTEQVYDHSLWLVSKSNPIPPVQ